jgi:DNA-binding MarR family transcriptional regulator
MANEMLGAIELSNSPAVLVLADTDAAASRARRSVELAGCRVIESVGLEGAVARLERHAGAAEILVELEGEQGPAIDDLLDHLQERAELRYRSSIISAPLELIDAVMARAPGPLIEHLIGADELQRVIAVAAATAPRKHMLHDAGREEGVPRLEELSRDVARIAAMLATLADREGRAQRLVPQHPAPAGGAVPMDAGAVRALIRARRLRDQYFGPDLFADPAWDILLDLYAAKLEHQRVAVSSLCIAAAVPATTALRWIKTLTDMGLLVRSADPQDGRRVYIELAPGAAARLEAYLGAAHRIAPVVL